MSILQGKYLPVTTKIGLAHRTLRYYWADGPFRAWRQLLAFPYHRLLRRPAPAFVDIATTYRCQCRCVHCSAEGHKRAGEEEMGTKEIKSIIDQARRLGALEIIFTGGEPLLRNDTFELVGHAHQEGMITRLNTNGLLLDRRTAIELKKAGLTVCGVSLDSAEALTHDQLRGYPGAFQKAVEGIRYLREVQVLSQILVYAQKGALPRHLKEMVALGNRLGASTMFIFFPIASGRWYNAFDKVLDARERGIVRGFQGLTFAHTEIPTKDSLCPHVSRLCFYITAYGDLTPCPVAHPIIGNIRKQALRELWTSYCSQLKLQYRDDCPLNDRHSRAEFEGFVDSFARKSAATQKAI